MKAPFWFVESGSKYRLLERGEDTGVTYASFEKAKADVSARNNAWRAQQAPRAKRPTKKRNPDRIPGGKADDIAIDFFDPMKLAKGIRHELEHTSDPEIASEIARDHLFEDPDYYEKLDYMERRYPPGKAFKPKGNPRRNGVDAPRRLLEVDTTTQRKFGDYLKSVLTNIIRALPSTASVSTQSDAKRALEGLMLVVRVYKDTPAEAVDVGFAVALLYSLFDAYSKRPSAAVRHQLNQALAQVVAEKNALNLTELNLSDFYRQNEYIRMDGTFSAIDSTLWRKFYPRRYFDFVETLELPVSKTTLCRNLGVACF